MTGTAETSQTLTTMEAGMILASGTEDDFWRVHDRMGVLVAGQPGFRAAIGGPIANSSWMYFCGRFNTPDHMNQWYNNRQHRPVMDKAKRTWFDAFYIRKWRLPAEGEALEGPLFCETSIVRETPLDEATVSSTVVALTECLPRLSPRPFETLAGQFEPQPFQFVGPLEEFPRLAPARYLLLTHWDDSDTLSTWLASPAMRTLSALGRVTTDAHVLIRHTAGERVGLNADGSHRSWSRAAAAKTT